jgi:uncharacterized DUF497 family protein
MNVRITFDERKRETNKVKHGYDFEDLTEAFFDDALFLDGKDGRYLAVGAFAGRLISVVFRPLGTEGISVVSMRRASRKERKAIE